MHGPGPLLFCEAEGLTDLGGHIIAANDLLRILRQGLHHFDNIDDLKLPLLTRLNRFLASNHHHRHGPELRVGRRGDKVGRTRPQCRHANTSLAGETAISRGHKTRRLFVAVKDQLDLLRSA